MFEIILVKICMSLIVCMPFERFHTIYSNKLHESYDISFQYMYDVPLEKLDIVCIKRKTLVVWINNSLVCWYSFITTVFLYDSPSSDNVCRITQFIWFRALDEINRTSVFWQQFVFTVHIALTNRYMCVKV